MTARANPWPGAARSPFRYHLSCDRSTGFDSISVDPMVAGRVAALVTMKGTTLMGIGSGIALVVVGAGVRDNDPIV